MIKNLFTKENSRKIKQAIFLKNNEGKTQFYFDDDIKQENKKTRKEQNDKTASIK